MQQHAVVLCIAATAELDFNGQYMEGLGPQRFESQRGMYMRPTYAWAHSPPAQDAAPPFPAWGAEPWVLALLVLSAALYLAGLMRFWRRSRAAAARCRDGAAHSSQAG